MNIEKKKFGNNELYIKPIGRIDIDSVSDFEREINDEINNITYLTIDFSDVNYISSTGLRALLAAQKEMLNKGEMKIVNVSPKVLEIFNMVGFDKVLNII